MTTHNPRVIRGYASGITVALNQCRDGSMIELDVGTGQAVRETLLNYARSLEPDPRRSYYLVFWNEEHPALLEVVKRLDPYLAVDLTDAMEFVTKHLPDTGTRETVALVPHGKPNAMFMVKGQVVARAIHYKEPPL